MEEPVTVQVPLQPQLLWWRQQCHHRDGDGFDGDLHDEEVDDGDEEVDDGDEEDSLSKWMSAPASNW